MVRPAGLFSNRYQVDDMPDLSGKVAIVVGGSRGIGESVTKALVQKNCNGESPGALPRHPSHP
jgi:5,10-methylene-tetrahydrofolate dehydrogenase/methenyl tetrahydrofolate cyclohydrolase